MTAKNRAGSRTPEHDVRLTGLTVARACLGLLELPFGGKLLEPSAGDGAWLQALDLELIQRGGGYALSVHANELRPSCRAPLAFLTSQLNEDNQPRVTIGRFERYLTRHGGFDLILGNPPYTYAERHVRHAMYLLRDGGMVAFLLGITFRGSKGRRDFYRDPRWGLWRTYLLEERPSFSGDGNTDATEYGLFCFRKGYSGDEVTRSFSWRDDAQYARDRDAIRAADWGYRA